MRQFVERSGQAYLLEGVKRKRRGQTFCVLTPANSSVSSLLPEKAALATLRFSAELCTMVIFHLVYCFRSAPFSALAGLILADLFTCKSDYGAAETAQLNGLFAESDDISASTNTKPETLDDGTQTVKVMK